MNSVEQDPPRGNRQSGANAGADDDARFHQLRQSWQASWRRAEEIIARGRGRATREGRLADYDANPPVPHPEDEAEVGRRLEALLSTGPSMESLVSGLMFSAGMALGMFAEDEAHMKGGFATASVTLAQCAEHAFRSTRRTRPAAGTDLLPGAVHETLFRDIPPVTILRCAIQAAGYVIGATSTSATRMRKRLTKCRKETERHARIFRSLALMAPMDTLVQLAKEGAATRPSGGGVRGQ